MFIFNTLINDKINKFEYNHELSIRKHQFKNKDVFFQNLSNYLIASYKINSKNYIFKKKIINLSLKNFFDFHLKNKSFFNFFYSYCFHNNNFLLLNDHYDYIYPFYKFIHGYRHMSMYKNFFFLNPINFTYKNWSYFFYKFCKLNNINLFFVLDYDYFLNFYKNIGELDCSVTSLIPYSYIDDYSDYPLYVFDLNALVKITYCSYIISIYSYAFNYKQIYKQFFFIKTFCKYIKIQS